MAPNALQGLLKALADPEADPNLRRRALRAYGLFLLGLVVLRFLPETKGRGLPDETG